MLGAVVGDVGSVVMGLAGAEVGGEATGLVAGDPDDPPLQAASTVAARAGAPRERVSARKERVIGSFVPAARGFGSSPARRRMVKPSHIL
jgi:hypothetical protein